MRCAFAQWRPPEVWISGAFQNNGYRNAIYDSETVFYATRHMIRILVRIEAFLLALLIDGIVWCLKDQ